jgi:hypothetical protein
MEGNVYLADNVADPAGGGIASVNINGRWVLARPVNYTAMFWWERLRVAWKVYRGEYDALKWVGQ